MTDLVEFLVENLVPDGDFVIETREGDGTQDIVIIVAKHDIGKVIGKQGRIAKAIRTLVKAASGKNSIRYNVVIEEQPELASEAAPVADCADIANEEPAQSVAPVTESEQQ